VPGCDEEFDDAGSTAIDATALAADGGEDFVIDGIALSSRARPAGRADAGDRPSRAGTSRRGADLDEGAFAVEPETVGPHLGRRGLEAREPE
jgi:hypothetical protein